MVTYFVNNRKYLIPNQWSELTAEQYLDIVQLIHQHLTIRETLVKAILILLSIRKHFVLRFQIMFMFSFEQKFELAQLSRWILEGEMDCTQNKLPIISVTTGKLNRKIKLFGPLDGCKLITFLEFIEADYAYLNFRSEKDPQKAGLFLDQLCAVLYRYKNPTMPRHLSTKAINKWNGDPRSPFNSNVMPYHTKTVARMDEKTKLGIFLFYHACHQSWTKLFPNIFRKSTEENPKGGNWIDAMLDLAGGAVHANQLMDTYAILALRDLDNKIAKSKE